MASATIESVLQEDRLFPPSPEFVRQANVSGAAAYQALCDEASRDFEGFWGRLAKEHVLWNKPFTRVLDESNAPFFKWFHDGELNASYNCLDRHLKTQGHKTAVIFEADDGKVTLPGVHALKPGSCTMPLPGITAAIVDETGHDVAKGKGGILVIKRPWPGIIRTIWGDPERFK